MIGCVTLDENTDQTGSLQPRREHNDVQLQQSRTGRGLPYQAIAGHISLQ